ncbi:hypothetical protein [Pseudoalteromonas sp. T1lg23B]|uniref:hypothetical protein n=1 Tax=Pseudoalteromonas sp. T1lg23B TaxID=2077097 RepID=UPI000CF705AD|nr:hypothetical protein [Pseudoalteromonas sp. T1lg23B]
MRVLRLSVCLIWLPSNATKQGLWPHSFALGVTPRLVRGVVVSAALVANPSFDLKQLSYWG